ncbi:hypothetical protein NOR_03875 [Metarhizium rileyi]|uniref:Uncharacterized protein n=1 Tax=Metarhizium rileyi (strain RCEF 4871) TaxID=1649241 RepID=A0A167EMA2_METRR|nr:hypothetical protein NOR_03875 [Metarhizium rileyi RCEF 4871]
MLHSSLAIRDLLFKGGLRVVGGAEEAATMRCITTDVADEGEGRDIMSRLTSYGVAFLSGIVTWILCHLVTKHEDAGFR